MVIDEFITIRLQEYYPARDPLALGSNFRPQRTINMHPDRLALLQLQYALGLRTHLQTSRVALSLLLASLRVLLVPGGF
jgi:hypothetical protein